MVSPPGGDRSQRAARLARYLERIRHGEQDAREELLEAYAPFALSIAARVMGRFVRLGSDDAANVALIALDEAVSTFAPDKGSFLGFATQVIRRRVIDHVRRDSRRSREIPSGVAFFGGDGDGDDANEPYLPRGKILSEIAARDHEDGEARRQELAFLASELAEYHLDLEQLSRVAPRHRDAREAAKAVARILVDDEHLREHLLQRRQLPLRELEYRTGVGRKSLERHRKYIIAVAVVLMGDYQHLQDYVAGSPDQLL